MLALPISLPLALEKGDLVSADVYYRNALRALDAVKYPIEATVETQLLAEDLIHTLNRLGEVLLRLNGGEATVPIFNRALQMAENLSASNPAVQHDRTVSKDGPIFDRSRHRAF